MSDEQSTPFTGLTDAEAVDRRVEKRAQEPAVEPEPIRTDETDTEASQEEATTEEVTEEATTQEAEAPEATEDKEEPISEDEEEEPEADDAVVEENEEPDEEPVYTITVDGKTEEVTLEELKRGHLREADYTRGKQTLATERQAVTDKQEHLTQQVEATALIMENALKASGDDLAEFAEMDNAAWEKLRQEDPTEFGLKYGQFNLAVQKRQELEAQAGQLIQHQQQQQMESNKERLVRETQLLVAAIPDMADIKEGPILMEKIKMYATETIGLSSDEAGSLTDHRLVVALNKARLYDELKGKVVKVGAKKKSKAPSKTVKSGSVPVKSTGQSKRVTDLRAKAKRTGDPGDAAEARLAMQAERRSNAS